MEIRQFDDNMPVDVFKGVQVIHQAVFDGATLKREKLHKPQFIGLVAFIEGEIAGFKFGYEHEDGAFYSWLGGVHPNFQRRGIAKALMHRQHEIAKEAGYSLIRTYSRNEKMPMLMLNLHSGFHIISTFVDDKGWHKIVLEKKL